jgi:parallel beta-helix repeat protein
MPATRYLSLILILSLLLFTPRFTLAFQHPSFQQFASPITQFTISKNAISFPTNQSTDIITVSITDSAIYRYVNTSYNGQNWVQRTLSAGTPSTCTAHPDDAGGTWLSGTCTLNVPVAAANFSFTAPGTSKLRNYITAYSCTENVLDLGLVRFRLGWDCHGTTATPGMWQIWNFSAFLQTAAEPTCSDGIQNQGETGVDCGGPCPSCSLGRTYYASPSGSNSNNGSIGTPFLTIAYGISKLKGGDSLFVRGGVYSEKLWVDSYKISGNATNPTIITAYPGEHPVIDCSSLTFGAGGYAAIFYTNYTSFTGFEIQNVNRYGQSGALGGGGIFSGGLHNIIGNCTVHDVWDGGIIVRGNYTTVEYNTVYNACLSNSDGIYDESGGERWSEGINARCGYPIIRHNSVHDVFGEGIGITGVDHGIVEDNTIYDIFNPLLYIMNTKDSLIQRNLMYMTKGMGINSSAVGIAHWNENSIVNHDNERNTIINNIAYGCRRNFYSYDSPNGSVIANNVFADSTFFASIQLSVDNGTNMTFANNIVVQEDSLPAIYASANPKVTYRSNLYSKDYDVDAAGVGDFIGDPMFSKSGSTGPGEMLGVYFDTLPGSPANDAGIVLTSVTEDYLRNPRGSSPDIGSFEHASTYSCSDGIKNGGEAGVDCGGSCSACSPYLRTFYVSNSGSDSNNGTKPYSPWKTIAKINNYTFSPGDGILFKRGDIWHEALTISRSGNSTFPITFSAYGSGNKPILSGFTTITGWTSEANGIYSKVITSAAQTNMVTIDGSPYGMGREPDGSYSTYESHNVKTSITDNQLTDTVDWAGAEVVINKQDWILDRCSITDHTGGTLTYTNLGSTDEPANNRGYFIQNDIRTLDVYGEWYHDISTGKFYMYFGAVNPTTKTVQVATISHLVYNNGYDYITIDNLNLTGSISDVIRLNSESRKNRIQYCDISLGGEDGIDYDGAYIIIDSNTITGCSETGIAGQWGTYGIITNNTIQNTGLIEGASKYGTLNQGILVYDNCLIQYNSIENIGYNGISGNPSVLGGNLTIKNNFINKAVMLLDDGGGVYLSGGTRLGPRFFEGNIILNSGVGNPNANLVEGIYLDENASNVFVRYNTVSTSTYSGIKMHKAQTNTIENNTFFNNNVGIYIQNSIENRSIYNNIVNNNIFFAKTGAQLALRFYSATNDIATFGTADYNYYARPMDDTKTFYTYEPATGYVLRTLAEWQAAYGHDLHSEKSPRTKNNYLDTNKFSNGNFTSNISGASCWNNIDNCALSWDDAKLDGGALRVSFNASTPTAGTYLSVPVGTITSGKNYMLRYSSISNSGFNFKVFLRKWSSPWTLLTDEDYEQITTFRSENEIFFSSTVTATDGVILFEINPVDSTNNVLWLDNVQLYEAANPDDYIRFEYNPTRMDKTVTLSGSYIDVRNTSYSGSVTLKPYTSIVLVKN